MANGYALTVGLNMTAAALTCEHCTEDAKVMMEIAEKRRFKRLSDPLLDKAATQT